MYETPQMSSIHHKVKRNYMYTPEYFDKRYLQILGDVSPHFVSAPKEFLWYVHDSILADGTIYIPPCDMNVICVMN